MWVGKRCLTQSLRTRACGSTSTCATVRGPYTAWRCRRRIPTSCPNVPGIIRPSWHSTKSAAVNGTVCLRTPMSSSSATSIPLEMGSGYTGSRTPAGVTQLGCWAMEPRLCFWLRRPRARGTRPTALTSCSTTLRPARFRASFRDVLTPRSPGSSTTRSGGSST